MKERKKKQMNIDEAREIIKVRLSAARFTHSCAVSAEAVKLAQKYQGETEKAALAGMLHDIAKDMPPEQQLQTIKKYSIMLDNVENLTPKLWHSILGAAVLEHELNIKDIDIINAVRYHTTARAGMSMLEIIIYLADFVSADRTFEGVEQLRTAIYTSLQAGLRAALEYSFQDLLGNNSPIHLDTVRARNELILKLKLKLKASPATHTN
jgi:predicted HD superfamily hydrolase involved in NAD metabolism